MRTTNSSQQASVEHLLGRRFSQMVECQVAVLASALKVLLQQLVGDESAMMSQGCRVQLVLQLLVLRVPAYVTEACRQLQLQVVVETIARHSQRL